MTPLSQRDPRWSSIILGTSNTTIGSHGCTITALAMLAGTTPDVVNEKLNAVSGFASGNLVIWSKINAALPNLKWEWRGYAYENEKVAANLPCLVEVDGARIGAPKHWVVYLGNQQMADPWYGNIKSTSYYPPTGYSIIKVIGNPMNGDALAACLKDRQKFWEERDVANKQLENLKKEMELLKEDVKRDVEAARAEAKKQKEQFDGLVAFLAEALGTTQDVPKIKAETEMLVDVEDQLEKERKENGVLTQKAQGLQSSIDQFLDRASGAVGKRMESLEAVLRALERLVKATQYKTLLEYPWVERFSSLFRR